MSRDAAGVTEIGNISDDELHEAARLVRDSMLESLPEKDEHEFSPEFEAKMTKLLARDRAHRSISKALQRVAAVLLLVALGSGVWLSVDVEARGAAVSWLRDVYENSVIYRFFNEADLLFPAYRLDSLNGRFSLVREHESMVAYDVLYRDETSGDWVYFEYHLARDGGILSILDEDSNSEKVSLSDGHADFYMGIAEDGSNSLVWLNNDSEIVFTLNSNLGREDLIAIAEGIK